MPSGDDRLSSHQPEPVDIPRDSNAKMPPRRPSVESGAVTSNQRITATIVHLLGIISGPFIVFLLWAKSRHHEEWVNEQAREALNFQLTILAIYLIGAILVVVYVGIIVVVLAVVCNVVLSVIAASQAYSGEIYQYPFSLELVKSKV